ncbi:hypothetical protein BpHYR1_013401 [Brachionus plicatilis]|uniref:Uncharacterized protein n=1 Tax=Brachionus plicatilis TaxID=10195 RepID=A0A3M7RGZ8_BRAPC|nr:hypothetical protein BpHYR1_013401 [Brachionus plicatilis]
MEGNFKFGDVKNNIKLNTKEDRVEQSNTITAQFNSQTVERKNKKYRKLVTITLGTMSKFGFIPYGTNTIETIINLDV